MSAHIAISCVACDRGRRYRDRSETDVDTAALQTTSGTSESQGKHVSDFSIRAMGTFEHEHTHSQLCSH